MSANHQRNVKWVEGLRGITSALVIMTHIARAWDFPLFWPSDTPDTPPRLLQLPILRIPFQGRVGVPIFAFLTGFVCAYKPLRLAYQHGNQHAALHAIARSAFRRPPRLALPAVVATVISFMLTVMGAYRTANQVDAFWVRFDAPDPVATFGEEVRRLVHTTLTTWTNTENIYDRHQWAMRPLLIGAFQVYITLAATIGMRFKYRIAVHLLLISYWLMNASPLTETFGANLALGTLLAELTIHRPTQNFIASYRGFLSYFVAPMLIITGLVLGSYPHEHEDWAHWSMTLHRIFVDRVGDRSKGGLLTPIGAEGARRMTSTMVQMCAVGLFLSPELRETFSQRWMMWLGKHSFAVYLVHGTILRTVGMWIVYGFKTTLPVPTFNEDGTPREPEWLLPKSNYHKGVAIIVFTILTYLAAWAWVRWVDSMCARTTEWLEKKVFDDENEEIGGKEGHAEKGFHFAKALTYTNGHANGNGFKDKGILGDADRIQVTYANGHTNGIPRKDSADRIQLSP